MREVTWEAEKETIESAFLHKLRLAIMGGKEQYTKEEICAVV